MVSVVSLSPTGATLVFKDTSMLILYKNVRNARFVLFTKTLSAWTTCCGMDLITGFQIAAVPLKVLSLILIENLIQC